MKRIILWGIFILIYFSATAQSPMLYSNQSKIYVSSNDTLYVKGSIVSTGNTDSLINEGNLYAKKTSVDGNFELDNNAVVIGDGTYSVDSDWINNATFIAQNSEVRLTGNNQNIKGSQITTFHNLTLFNAGAIKTMQIDANIDNSGMLTFNDSLIELATGINTLYILNPSVSAIITTGTADNTSFISSIAPGTLSRNTNSTSTYRFPTGSSTGTLRYRPVDINPIANVSNTYTVRLINYDPNIDGYNRSQKQGVTGNINDLYYHYITHSLGSTNADITFNYIASADGLLIGAAYWNTGISKWDGISGTSLTPGSPFSTVKIPSWNFPQASAPYALFKDYPLPITLVYFNAVKDGNYTRTYWQTLSEENISHYIVERSTEESPSNFIEIGQLPAQGNTGQANNYLLYDEQPYLGVNYYRLKIIENGGTYRYSNIVPVTFDGSNNFDFAITPNPNRSNFQLIFNSNNISLYNIHIYNSIGQIVYKNNFISKKGTNEIKPNLTLASGFYWIKLGNDKQFKTKKLVIVK